MYKNYENIQICDHPLVKHKITILRDKNTGTNEFRTVVSEISMLLGYEALRDLPLKDVEVETPLETAMCPTLDGETPALVPILRAGLGMVDGFLRLLPTAKVGHIGLARNRRNL